MSADAAIAAILTDIEGTTTDVRFVHDVLFPYAARALPEFLAANAARADVAAELAAVRARIGEPGASVEEVTGTLVSWIAEDRKETPLKALQGLVWEAGYRSGALVAPVYADAVEALRRWHADGLALYVYSSGSEAAQKLLFAHTVAGDLTGLFSGYFDTRVGSKLDAESYDAVAGRIGCEPGQVLFHSDHPGEVAAALAAGMAALRIDRARAADAAPREEDGQTVLGGFARVAPERERCVA